MVYTDLAYLRRPRPNSLGDIGPLESRNHPPCTRNRLSPIRRPPPTIPPPIRTCASFPECLGCASGLARKRHREGPHVECALCVHVRRRRWRCVARPLRRHRTSAPSKALSSRGRSTLPRAPCGCGAAPDCPHGKENAGRLNSAHLG